MIQLLLIQLLLLLILVQNVDLSINVVMALDTEYNTLFDTPTLD